MKGVLKSVFVMIKKMMLYYLREKEIKGCKRSKWTLGSGHRNPFWCSEDNCHTSSVMSDSDWESSFG